MKPTRPTSRPAPAPQAPRQAGAAPWWLYALVAATALAVFAPALGTGAFINGDASVLKLPVLSSWRHLGDVFTSPFTNFTEGQYRPLGYAVLATLRSFISPDRVLFWHLLLVAVWALDAMLVLAIARRFTSRILVALVAAGVFLLNPLNVVFAHQVNNFYMSLATAFYLAAFLFYLRFAVAQAFLSANAAARRKRDYLAALAFFAAGLFASKVLMTLPLFLLLFETLYERRGFFASVKRVLPFGAVLLAALPCWLVFAPHPLYFQYVGTERGIAWPWLFSFIGATPNQVAGLLAGWRLPAPLHETVERIYILASWKVWVWGVLLLALAAAGVWASRRRRLSGLGILLVMTGLIPYCSSVVNSAVEFISWSYLCLPLAGWALAAASLFEWGTSSTRRPVRAAAVALAALLFVPYVWHTLDGSIYVRSAEGYWRRAAAANPDGEVPEIQLGRIYLARGDEAGAINHFFSKPVASVYSGCLSMAAHYAREGDLLASAIHLRMGQNGKLSGLQNQEDALCQGEVMRLAGARDFAEQFCGHVLMANPFSTVAMKRLAGILEEKGYLGAAMRYLERARDVDPSDEECPELIDRLRARMLDPEDRPAPPPRTAPSGDWLRFAGLQAESPVIVSQVIDLAGRRPDDPIIQIEAAVALAEEGQNRRALEAATRAADRLQSFSYAWSIKCLAARKLGDFRLALASAEHARKLNSQDWVMWHGMAQLMHQQGKLEETVLYYKQAARINPNYVSLNDLGVALSQLGRHREACDAYRQALKLKPDIYQAHNNLGWSLMELGQFDEAIKHFRSSIEIDPTKPQPWRSLSRAYMMWGDYAKAASACATMLKAFPEDIECSVRMAKLLSAAPDARVRDGAAAIRIAEELLRSGKYSQHTGELLDVLAAGYAETGQFDLAEKTAREAVLVLRSEGDVSQASGIESRIRLYHDRQPFRMGPGSER
jgi:tetratricopeptide (TPR) repeat protein